MHIPSLLTKPPAPAGSLGGAGSALALAVGGSLLGLERHGYRTPIEARQHLLATP